MAVYCSGRKSQNTQSQHGNQKEMTKRRLSERPLIYSTFRCRIQTRIRSDPVALLALEVRMSTPPPAGEKITIRNGKLAVPDKPIIPFIEGDGTGPDIWRASVRVLDAAVHKAYGGKRRLQWLEVFAGEKAFRLYQTWLPDATLDAFRDYLVGSKGPLTTPIGGGIRSLNVALRQQLDLYACVRPVRWFRGVPSPVKPSPILRFSRPSPAPPSLM